MLAWGRPTVVLRREIVVRVEAAAAVGLAAERAAAEAQTATDRAQAAAEERAPKVCSGV